jgi:hypothetical protein
LLLAQIPSLLRLQFSAQQTPQPSSVTGWKRWVEVVAFDY